jgi:hypothetical protein
LNAFDADKACKALGMQIFEGATRIEDLARLVISFRDAKLNKTSRAKNPTSNSDYVFWLGGSYDANACVALVIHTFGVDQERKLCYKKYASFCEDFRPYTGS